MHSILRFSIVYKDDTRFYMKILPKKAYRKYFFVIHYTDGSKEQVLFSFEKKEDYKRAIYRLHYLLDTKYRNH